MIVMSSTATTLPILTQQPKIPVHLKLTGLLFVAMAGFLVYDQWVWWNTREDYSFGFIVPLFVAYVLYERWPKIKGLLLQGEWDGKPVDGYSRRNNFLTSLAVFFTGCVALGGLFTFGLGGFLQGITNNPLLPGSQALAFGFAVSLLSFAFLAAGWVQPASGQTVPLKIRWYFMGLFVFPALIWLLSVPMLNFAERQISLFLLNQVTVVVFHTFDILAIPLERQGNVLILEKGSVGVEDACSGIRSLTACLFAGSFLAAVFLDRWWKKVLLVGFAMLFAFIMNIFRSLFLTAWAHMYGSESIDGAVHDYTGYAVLIFTCIGLLALLPLFNFKYKFTHDSADDPPDLENEGTAQ